MAFMIPEYTSEPFIEGETFNGEGFAFPANVSGTVVPYDHEGHGGQTEITADGPIRHSTPGTEKPERVTARRAVRKALAQYIDSTSPVRVGSLRLVTGKHWARLTAPGYMDQTEWIGPFDSRKEARAALAREHEIDPDTGEDLPDGADWPDGSEADP